METACEFIKIQEYIINKKDIYKVSEIKPLFNRYKVVPARANFWGREFPERVEKITNPIEVGYSMEIKKLNNEVIEITKGYINSIAGLNDWYAELKTIRENLIKELGFEVNPNVKQI